MSNRYITLEDMTAAFGHKEIGLLCSTQEGAFNHDALYSAISRAQSEIDSYLGTRYLVPLETVPEVIVDVCVNLTRYRLTGSDGRFVSEAIRLRYEDAVRFLKDVSKGVVKLSLAEVGNAPQVNKTTTTKGYNAGAFGRDKTHGGAF